METAGMSPLPFGIANNWDDFPELRRRVPWHAVAANREAIVFEAAMEGARWQVRLNDFPAEPLYTLLIDGAEKLHFDDWPAFWGPRG